MNRIRRAWPDALDLMLLCVEAGMSVEHAFKRVSKEIGMQSPELAEELTLTTAESCTCGLMASLMGDIPGCGQVLDSGFVARTLELKDDGDRTEIEFASRFLARYHARQR